MRNQYSHLQIIAEVQLGDHLRKALEPILQISYAMYPVSPAKIIILLKRAFGDQGSGAFGASHEQYHRAVARHAQEIRDRHAAEASDYANAYARRTRVTSALRSLRKLLSLIGSFFLIVAIIEIIALALPYYLDNRVHSLLNSWLHSSLGFRHPPSLQTFLTVFIATVIASAFTSLLARLTSHELHHAYKSMEPATQILDRRLIHEFQAVAVDLMRTTNERRLDPMLRSDRAPTLVEMESARILPSETFDEVMDFLQLHVTSAVGIAGRRGAGKSTLLRWLVYALEPDWVAVYLPTPAAYNATDFARMIFRTTASAVLASYQSKEIPVRSRILSSVIGVLRPRPTGEEIVRISNEVLNLITVSKTDQWTTMGGFSAKGASMQRQKQTTISSREPTHPELIAAFTQYLESYRRLGGRRIAIAIDELDKLATTEEAIGVVNNLKDLFHLPNTHFVVSVSEDALMRFAMRGIPFRDVFDSAFDSIIQMTPPSPEDGWKLLAQRTGGFPISAALFCYAWSGGLPRDLIRTARACVDVRRRLGKPVKTAALVQPVVRRDVKEALDAVLTNILEGSNQLGTESLLTLRRKVDDESVSLDSALYGAELRRELEADDVEETRALMLRRLALYIDLGRAVAGYYTANVDEIMMKCFDEVLTTSLKFAQAKLALSTYPAEAEWFLSEALRNAKTNS